MFYIRNSITSGDLFRYYMKINKIYYTPAQLRDMAFKLYAEYHADGDKSKQAFAKLLEDLANTHETGAADGIPEVGETLAIDNVRIFC